MELDDFRNTSNLGNNKTDPASPQGHKDKSSAWVINSAMGKMLIYHALLYSDIAIERIYSF